MTDVELLTELEARLNQEPLTPDHLWLLVAGEPKHYELRNGQYVETPWVEL